MLQELKHAVAGWISKIGDVTGVKKLVSKVYGMVSPHLAELAKHASELKAAIKEGSKEKLMVVKDAVDAANEKVDGIYSDISSKFAAQVAGRIKAQPRKAENKENYGKDVAKAIVASEVKKAEGVARAFLAGVDELTTLNLESETVPALALQIIANAYLLIGKVISAPAQIAIKSVAGTIAGATK